MFEPTLTLTSQEALVRLGTDLQRCKACSVDRVRTRPTDDLGEAVRRLRGMERRWNEAYSWVVAGGLLVRKVVDAGVATLSF